MQSSIKQLFILVFSIVVFQSCSQKLAPPPSCIREKIEWIKSRPKWNPPAEINEYEYKGQKVFVITADCCDRYIIAVDSNCNTICAPAGGITGNGDRKCSDFFQVAKHIRLVWKDER